MQTEQAGGEEQARRRRFASALPHHCAVCSCCSLFTTNVAAIARVRRLLFELCASARSKLDAGNLVCAVLALPLRPRSSAGRCSVTSAAAECMALPVAQARADPCLWRLATAVAPEQHPCASPRAPGTSTSGPRPFQRCMKTTLRSCALPCDAVPVIGSGHDQVS